MDQVQRKALGESPRLKAAQKGSRRFLGNPCKVCSGLERYTSSGGCVRCTNAKADARAQKVKALLRNAT